MNLRAARIASLVVLVVALSTVWVLPVAGAPVDDKRAEAKRLQAQIDANGDRIAALGEQYDGAQLRYQHATQAIADAERRLVQSQNDWNAIRKRVGARAALIYMSASTQSPLQEIDVASVNELMSRSKYSAAISGRDDALLGKLSSAREDLAARRKSLEQTRTQAKNDRDRIAAARHDIEAANAKQQQLLSQVKGELAKLIEKEQARRASAARARAAADAARLAERTRGAVARGGGVGPDTPLPNVPSPSGGAAAAIAYARAQLGKSYVYNTAGPDTFDCSGLTMMAWRAGGVSMPHYSGAQYAMFPHVPIDQLQPGDLVFKGPGGSDHVALYVGGGMQIAATHTGSYVLLQPVQYGKLSGAARPG